MVGAERGISLLWRQRRFCFEYDARCFMLWAKVYSVSCVFSPCVSFEPCTERMGDRGLLTTSAPAARRNCCCVRSCNGC